MNCLVVKLSSTDFRLYVVHSFSDLVELFRSVELYLNRVFGLMLLWGEVAEDTLVVSGVFDFGFFLEFELIDLLFDDFETLLDRTFGVEELLGLFFGLFNWRESSIIIKEQVISLSFYHLNDYLKKFYNKDLSTKYLSRDKNLYGIKKHYRVGIPVDVYYLKRTILLENSTTNYIAQ